MDSKVVYVGALIVVVLIAAFLLIRTTAATNQVALQLTDPPQVPSGTQALVIAYSSLQVHLGNAGNQSGWVSASGSGSVNLLAVVNLSQTIGVASLPANATINLVRFNVTSATITINGTKYNVTVPSSRVTAHIAGRTSVNKTTSILLDMSPVVATIITNSSTVFVLVPSVKAVIIPHATNSTTLRFGTRTNLTKEGRAELEDTRPNLTIANASIAVLPGNVTRITVTVKNNANTSVVLRHLGLFGNASVELNLSSVRSRIQSEISSVAARLSNACVRFGIQANASVSVKAPTSGLHNSSGLPSIASEAENEASSIASRVANGSGRYGRYVSNVPTGGLPNVSGEIESRFRQNVSPAFEHIPEGSDIAEHINASVCTQAGLRALRQRINSSISRFSTEVEDNQEHFKFVLLSITSSGSLVVPSSVEDTENLTNGLNLGAGQSATLSFNAPIALARGHIVYVPIVGRSYRIGVQGEEGARVVVNVTALTGH